MKKAFFFLAILSVSTNCFADWICEKQNSIQEQDTLKVPISCTNGKEIVGEEVSVFRPKSKQDVKIALDNMAATIRDRQKVILEIQNTVKPEVDFDGELRGEAQ